MSVQDVPDELLLRGIEEMPGGFIVTDPHQPDNPIVFASGGFEDLTGYSSADIEGRNCRFLQGEDTDQESVREIRSAVDAREPIATVIRNHRKDGTPFWNQLMIIPIFDGGDIQAFFGFQRDVTDQIEAENILEGSFESAKSVGVSGRSESSKTPSYRTEHQVAPRLIVTLAKRQC
jgi:PAS domain S-box-containing protein